MNILFVDHYNVFKPQFGAEQRSNLLLQACCKIASVDIILWNEYHQMPNIENCKIIYENNIEKDKTFLQKIKPKINTLISFDYECICSIDKKKQKIVANFLSQKHYDYIVVRYIPNAINYGLLNYIDRLVIDIDDNPILSLTNHFTSPINSRFRKFARWLYWKIIEIKLFAAKKAYSKIVNSIKIPFVSNIDDIRINECKCVHLPNVSFTESNAKLCDFSATSKRVIWVGLVKYQPNYLGLEHFFEFIYPKVVKIIPDFEVVIVGKYGDYDVSKWQKLHGVTVKGFVEDLELEYSSTRAAIIPCYSGAGTNIKVLEAMRMKRPCITSEYGARGYDKYFDGNQDYLVCKNDDEFANSIIDVLENEQKNHTIGNNGYQKVSKYFSKDRFFNIVASSFNKTSNLYEHS